MKFTNDMIEKIDRSLSQKKKLNPVSPIIAGIGVNLQDSIGGATIFKDNWAICEIEDLSRMIEELQMIKEAIEEETGLIL